MKRSFLTRRHVLAAAVVAPTGALTCSGGTDAELLWLGREFLRLAGQIDQLVDRASPDSDADDLTLGQLLKDMDAIEDAALQHKAGTISGLAVKAWIVHWAKCQDLSPDDVHFLADRMMLSLIRDLIALQGSSLSASEVDLPTKEGNWT